MKKLLLGTTLLAGLAHPAFAVENTIAIQQTLGTNGSLVITQDPTAPGSTVSADGTTGTTATALSLTGSWHSIAITQTGANNTFETGTSPANLIRSASASTTASLTAAYTTTGTGLNTHTLTIGQTTAPLNPTVGITVTNESTHNNTITDAIDAGSLTYTLNLDNTSGGSGADTVTNTTSGTTGSVTLAEGNGAAASATNYFGIGNGGSNSVSNVLAGGSAAVSVTQYVWGDSNTLHNTVTTDGTPGAITLIQGGDATHGIVGSNNSVINGVGAVTPVTSFVQHLYVDGSNNTVLTKVDGSGATEADVSIAGAWVNYGLTSEGGTGANSSFTFTGTGGTGTGAASDYVRIEQTSSATNATATLSVVGNTFTMGHLLVANVTGTYATDTNLAGVAVYQNTANAALNATVTAAGNGYKASFQQ